MHAHIQCRYLGWGCLALHNWMISRIAWCTSCCFVRRYPCGSQATIIVSTHRTLSPSSQFLLIQPVHLKMECVRSWDNGLLVLVLDYRGNHPNRINIHVFKISRSGRTDAHHGSIPMLNPLRWVDIPSLLLSSSKTLALRRHLCLAH
jgi:hypothetical protein